MHRSHRSPGILTSLFLLLLALTFAGPGLAGDAGLIAKAAQPLDQVEPVTLPAVDHGLLLAEDAAADGPGVPLRYAETQAVFHTPFTSGAWEALADGSALWRLRLRSPGAVSLSVAFTRYSMPDGGSLIFYPPTAVAKPVGALVHGPYTRRHNTHDQLWTPIVPGDEAVIEVRVPAQHLKHLTLELTEVHHGYRAFGTPDRAGIGGDKSGSCNVDVACPEADPWDPQVRSVGVYSAGGTRICTGFMVNNAGDDLRPLFMTADHCGVGTQRDPASLVVYWNYQHPTCRPPGSVESGTPYFGNLDQNQSGSTLVARGAVSDYTLLELDQMPDMDYNVHWAGWDARPLEAATSLTVHHPRAQAKRISFEDQPTTTTSYLQDDVPGNGTHLRVEDWDLGTTEPGSSGSPLFNQDGRVIGQLHGGAAACGNDDPDWYGRLSRSWELGLQQHLDPGDTGAMVLDGRDQVPKGPCVPTDTTMCLVNQRFQVTVTWRDFAGNEGNAHVVPFGSDDSGLFWFFDPDNWEMLVKMVDGCDFNSHYWVFSAATTNVEYTLRVEDLLANDEVRTYDNLLGEAAPAITDTFAFMTCP